MHSMGKGLWGAGGLEPSELTLTRFCGRRCTFVIPLHTHFLYSLHFLPISQSMAGQEGKAGWPHNLANTIPPGSSWILSPVGWGE